ncbi:hypothetical protein MHYP_G00311010 [Metynnis hypsauchen]
MVIQSGQGQEKKERINAVHMFLHPPQSEIIQIKQEELGRNWLAVGLARHGSVLDVVVRGQTWTCSSGTGSSQLLWLLAASSPSILHTFLDVPRVQLVYCHQHSL